MGLNERVISYLDEHLKPGRVAHTHRVAKMAVKLAKIHGASEEKAYLAGLLHDMAKYYKPEAVQGALIEMGIEDPYLFKAPQLAHGEIAAVLAKSIFGVTDEDVLNAVRYHTYGRRGMSQLEKIVFLADYIEDGRDFKGIDMARQHAFADLHEGMFFVVSHSIRYLLDRGDIIHPNALEVYNEWLEQLKEKS